MLICRYLVVHSMAFQFQSSSMQGRLIFLLHNSFTYYVIVFTGSCTKSCIAQHVTQCSIAGRRKIITYCFHRELYQKLYCPTCYLMLHCRPQEDHYLLFSQGVVPKAVLPNMLPNAPLPAAGRSLLIVFTGSCTKSCIAQHVT